MTLVILFVLGTVIGSFLNVVGLRWGRQNLTGTFSNFGGRSSCMSCGGELRWWELVPIVSFFMLQARCHRCQNKISWQYPLVEFWTGLIFVSVPYIFIPVFCIFVVITIYDLKHQIIPDELVYAAILFGFLIRLFLLPYSLADWIAGPIIFTFFGSIWLLSRGRAMGFGDAKLGLAVGLLLGLASGLSAIVLAFWIGAASSLIYILLNRIGHAYRQAGFLKNAKELTMKSEVPFAPFIIFGAWISLFFQFNLLHVALF